MSVGDQVMGSTTWDLLPGRQYWKMVQTMNKGMLLSVSSRVEHTHGKDVCFQDWGSYWVHFLQNNRDSIVFSPRGWLRNPSADFNTYGYMGISFLQPRSHPFRCF